MMIQQIVYQIFTAMLVIAGGWALTLEGTYGLLGACALGLLFIGLGTGFVSFFNAHNQQTTVTWQGKVYLWRGVVEVPVYRETEISLRDKDFSDTLDEANGF